ncbi:MAG TPA: GldG family protein [Methylomirabilota bacterium]|nr:GldG family protein [Methylomirabilota bacterium]
MPTEPSPTSSFSTGRRWAVILNVVLAVLSVTALVLMANYLGARYFVRVHATGEGRTGLSPMTLGLLRSITNDVKIIVYFDKQEPVYNTVMALLKEYQAASPRIRVESIDYFRDAAAHLIKTEYSLSQLEDRNVVIFDANEKHRIVPGGVITTSEINQVPSETGIEFERRTKTFNGELLFTSALSSVLNPQPLKVCFLTGHGEHDPLDTQLEGYSKLTEVLRADGLDLFMISLAGTNQVPADCDVLIIAGPKNRLPSEELEKIEHYLGQGRRLMVLFNYLVTEPTGLEPLLARWGVEVGNQLVTDPENTQSSGFDLLPQQFSNHPIVRPLAGSRLRLLLPRRVGALGRDAAGADAANVEELVWTGAGARFIGSISEGSRIQHTDAPPSSKPLMVAVEKGSIRGVRSGSTRIVVCGDSLFLNNQFIDVEANRDFAHQAVNWLLARTEMLGGIGPRPVTEYRLSMTETQMTMVRWILLVGMPASVLVLGGLVWLRRRS